jgi:hypothetical protein
MTGAPGVGKIPVFIDRRQSMLRRKTHNTLPLGMEERRRKRHKGTDRVSTDSPQGPLDVVRAVDLQTCDL